MKNYFNSNLTLPKIVLCKFNLYLFLLFIFYSSIICGQNLSSEKIYKKVSDAVVVIHAFDFNNQLSKQGSGVVISEKGYVVTNYHVLAGCERLEILHNKEIVPYVDIIGIDVEKDILILKIKEKKFSAIKIGNSKSLNIGQKVYAIGSPLGFENSISEGIISGLRNYGETGKNFIQITAGISSGSSGGAIVNDKGELIGISTLTIKEGQNLNFAIPIDVVLSVEISSYSKNDSYKDFELFYKGNDAVDKGNYQDAIKYYTSYIKKFPDHDGAYYNRGNSKAYLEDYRGSILDYNEAIKINPNYSNAYYNRGQSKSNLKDYRGAILDYSKAIEINPNFAIAYMNRGIQKYQLEDKLGACLDWSKAGELGDDNAYEFIREFCN